MAAIVLKNMSTEKYSKNCVISLLIAVQWKVTTKCLNRPILEGLLIRSSYAASCMSYVTSRVEVELYLDCDNQGDESSAVESIDH